jgi:myo-inositol 2-dehydrogenase/D-chiro-inositol 1-dehydrogenase
MDPIGIGLIGCGRIARAAHLPALAALAGRVQLVAVADPDEAAASAAAVPWGAQAYADYRLMLDRGDVAAVIVATPEAFHPEQVITAADRGKHVLCEKPIAATLAGADAMISACEGAGVHLLVGHSRRFTRRYIEVQKAISEGAIGPVRLARENERRARSRTGQQGGLWTTGHWTGDPSYAGAALMNGIHEADLLRWFVGEEPVSVYATQRVTVEDNAGVPDFLTFMLRFASGAIGSSEISNGLPPGYPAYHQLELYGIGGAVRAKDHELLPLVRFSEVGADFPGAQAVLQYNAATYVRQLAEFVTVARGERAPSMPPSEARRALAIALACVQSARSGREVMVDGPSGLPS